MFDPLDKRKLSEKQREKMKEKRDSSHIPAMYSACDNSQSRSQYYDDTQVTFWDLKGNLLMNLKHFSCKLAFTRDT